MENAILQLIRQNELARLGMGTWNMGDKPKEEDGEIAALQHGLDLGMKIIDTAEMYGEGRSEKLVGKAIQSRREEVYLISKVLPNNASYEGVQNACNRSLKNLDTDYLDLYLLHWQGHYPFQETIDAFEELKAKGRIKDWGVSNMDVKEMDEIIHCEGGTHCQTNQVLYNLTRRGIEYDLLPWQHSNKMPVMAYSPIEQGRLLSSPVLLELGEKHKASAAQIALAWVLRDSLVIPIPKTSNSNRVEENFNSLKINLDEEDLIKLDKVFQAPLFKMALQTI